MSADETTETPPAPEPATDDARSAIVDALRAALGDDLVDVHLIPGVDLWVRVTTGSWRRAIEAARAAGFDHFTFLSAIDWMPSPWGRGEDDPTEPTPERSTAVEQGFAGGDTRFQVFARLANLTTHLGFTLKVDVPDATMSVESIAGVFAGADWHERETWEMYGISFDGHPGLRHIYLPGDFEGHPLRKDFPLLARMVKPWPGIVDVEPMPAGVGGDDESESDEESTE